MKRHYGDDAFKLVSRCYGFEETDLGAGLVSELVRDDSGKIARSAKEYLINEGRSESFNRVLEEFSNRWVELSLPSRQLLPHNIVVQCDSQGQAVRLVVIDGLGSGNLLPTQWFPAAYQKRKALEKISGLIKRIDVLLAEIESGKQFSNVGKLIHDGTE